jgi:hypothetical protein
LIDAIVKQTTVLLAQLATSGGLRAPLAHVANQVFVDLSRELEAQGVSRKVSADMFGMALRSYLRKVQRLRESSTDRGRTLWEAIYGHLRSERVVTRKRVLERFHRDDEAVVRGVLHDLTESGLVFVSGAGQQTTYRVATDEELAATQNDRDSDELVWVIVYRYGPLDREAIREHLSVPAASLDTALERLVSTGRIQKSDEGDATSYSAKELVVPLDATQGWEASVFDHYHALVQTICRKLGQEPRASGADTTGGSTYTFEVWAGHPYEERTSAMLRRFREEQSELRKLVQGYNDEHRAPVATKRVVVYAGQYVAEEEDT